MVFGEIDAPGDEGRMSYRDVFTTRSTPCIPDAEGEGDRACTAGGRKSKKCHKITRLNLDDSQALMWMSSYMTAAIVLVYLYLLLRIFEIQEKVFKTSVNA